MSTIAPSLTDEQIRRILELAAGSDSIELKVTVPSAEQQAVVKKLDLDPLDARLRQVYFFDTPDLTLYHAGLVVRARRTQGRPDDSTVKLRPVEPHTLPAKLRASPDFVTEIDMMPGGFVCSGSYKGVLATRSVRDSLARGKSIRKLFSKEQRAFYSEHAPDGLALDDLTVLGPITTLKLNAVPDGFGRKLVGELWMYPDGSRVVELSTKCKPDRTFDTAAKARAFLQERGVDLSSEQQTKTKTALEFFTKG